MAVRSAISSIETYLRGILPSSAVVVSKPDAISAGSQLSASVFAVGFTPYRRGRVYNIVVRIQSPKNSPYPTEAQAAQVLATAEMLVDHVTELGADDLIVYWPVGISVSDLDFDDGAGLTISLPLCAEYPTGR